VPLAGWTAGRDLRLRRAYGQLPNRAALRTAERERAGAVAALAARLAADGLWPPDAPADGRDPRWRAAVHAFLCRTPCALAGIALDDLVGTVDPVNLPGVDLDRYPSWTRRAGLPLEALRTDAQVRAALAGTCRRTPASRRRRTYGKPRRGNPAT
jgi:4-alpha-glucanotransferase